MTAPEQHDIARIAAGLTKAQRQVLLRLSLIRERRAIDFSGQVASSLSWSTGKRPNLVTRAKRNRYLWFGLNNFGLAVRAHLEARA